jgi:hypothetical protein
MITLTILFVIALVIAAYLYYLSRTDPAEYYWKLQTLQGSAAGGTIVFIAYILIQIMLGNISV